jgi:hypothetical protein
MGQFRALPDFKCGILLSKCGVVMEIILKGQEGLAAVLQAPLRASTFPPLSERSTRGKAESGEN